MENKNYNMEQPRQYQPTTTMKPKEEGFCVTSMVLGIISIIIIGWTILLLLSASTSYDQKEVLINRAIHSHYIDVTIGAVAIVLGIISFIKRGFNIKAALGIGIAILGIIATNKLMIPYL